MYNNSDFTSVMLVKLTFTLKVMEYTPTHLSLGRNGFKIITDDSLDVWVYGANLHSWLLIYKHVKFSNVLIPASKKCLGVRLFEMRSFQTYA